MKSVEDKLDKISERLDDIVKVQIEQAADLKHHIYRTDLAEARMDSIEEDLKPIKKHVDMLNGALKAVGGLAVLASIVKAVIEVWKFFS